jgi:hypothetical protein
VPPFGGTSSPPCTIWILLMNEGAAASLPVWGSLSKQGRGILSTWRNFRLVFLEGTLQLRIFLLKQTRDLTRTHWEMEGCYAYLLGARSLAILSNRHNDPLPPTHCALHRHWNILLNHIPGNHWVNQHLHRSIPW